MFRIIILVSAMLLGSHANAQGTDTTEVDRGVLEELVKVTKDNNELLNRIAEALDNIPTQKDAVLIYGWQGYRTNLSCIVGGQRNCGDGAQEFCETIGYSNGYLVQLDRDTPSDYVNGTVLCYDRS